MLMKTVVLIWIINCRNEPGTNEMRPTASYNMGLVFQRYTDPNQADMLKKLSTRTTNLKIGMTKRRITINTIERLMKHKVGSNVVE